MKENISGRCVCGEIKYTVTVESQFTLICHCKQCQRITGSGHAAQFAVPVEETVIEGELRFYEQKAESGNTVSSGFCAICGSPILKKTTQMPELLFFHAGTLDDPSTFTPQIVVFEDSKQPWDHVDPAIPRK